MASRRLGRTGLSVPALALGMMTLGREADESMSHALLPACLDAGINFFDCANIHGLGKANTPRSTLRIFRAEAADQWRNAVCRGVIAYSVFLLLHTS